MVDRTKRGRPATSDVDPGDLSRSKASASMPRRGQHGCGHSRTEVYTVVRPAGCEALRSVMTALIIRLIFGAIAVAFVVPRGLREARSQLDGWQGWALCATSLGLFVVRDGLAFAPESLFGVAGPAMAFLAASAAFASLFLLSDHGAASFQRIREAVEATLIAGGLCITAWVAFLGDIVEASQRGRGEKFLLVGSPVGAAAITAYAFLVVLRTPSGTRSSLVSYATGTAFMLVAETVVAVNRLQHGSAVESSTIMQTAFVVSSALAYLSFARGATQPTTMPATSRGSRFRMTLWLLPSMLALAFALPRLRPGINDPTLLAIAGAVIAVHLAHQWFMVVESHRLVEELDARVEARTRELATREDYYRGLFEHSTDIVAVVGADQRFRDHTPSLIAVLGWRPEELDGVHVDDLLLGLGAHDAHRSFRKVLSGASDFEAVHDRLLHTDGTWRDVEMHMANHLDDPSVRGVIVTTRDITARRRLESQLVHQAFHDPLTGLANRALFRTTAERSMDIAASHDRIVSVLLLDLDGFKEVNDTLGHQAGDELLRLLADRVGPVGRVEDTWARLGGDEFALLVESGGSPEQLAWQLEAVLQEPFMVSETILHLSASIGIADTVHASSVDDLLRNADVAMYCAKSDPQRSSARFDPSMNEQSARRLQLLTDLRRAIDRDEFVVWLQPIVSLRSGTIGGFEALVRWQHPTLGLLLPVDFIPGAEESGLIVALGDLILRKAVAVSAPALIANDWYLSVNVSARQLEDAQLLDTTEELLRTTGLRPEMLVLEITESAVMTNPELARVRLERISATGVRIALDDFGTGYSSLSALSKFPLDMLKVDRSFVVAMQDDPASASALLSAIDEIGRALDLTVVAEGIETCQERNDLVGLGYHLGQGYLFNRPAPAAEALASASPTGVFSAVADI